jgi:hypothetical protein
VWSHISLQSLVCLHCFHKDDLALYLLFLFAARYVTVRNLCRIWGCFAGPANIYTVLFWHLAFAWWMLTAVSEERYVMFVTLGYFLCWFHRRSLLYRVWLAPFMNGLLFRKQTVLLLNSLLYSEYLVPILHGHHYWEQNILLLHGVLYRQQLVSFLQRMLWNSSSVFGQGWHYYFSCSVFLLYLDKNWLLLTFIQWRLSLESLLTLVNRLGVALCFLVLFCWYLY